MTGMQPVDIEFFKPERLEQVNHALPEAVQARGRAFVTGTVLDGRETLRACILHPGTSSEHLATLITEVLATARTLVADAERVERARGDESSRAAPS